MKKDNSTNSQKYIFSILFVLLILVEVFITANYPKQLLWIAGIGILILVDNCLLISTLVKEKEDEKEKQGQLMEQLVERLAEIDKSEKASYILYKKSFMDLDERMSHMEKLIVPISHDIEVSQRRMENAILQSMEDNRKVAKIIIGRSKENADALMNSNDEFAEKFNVFVEKMEQIENKISSIDIAPSTENSKIDAEQYQEILAAINSLKGNVKEDVSELELPEEFDLAFEEPELEPEFAMMEEPELEPEFAMMEEPKLESEPDIIPEMAIEAEVEEPAAPDFSDPNKVMSPDDIAALLASIGGNTEEGMSDTEIEPEFEAMEETAAPDFSDPNKVMSPEDIAALIASI